MENMRTLKQAFNYTPRGRRVSDLPRNTQKAAAAAEEFRALEGR
jgi:hypothetical protein